MGWGGGLNLSKAQKSAATSTHPLLTSVVGTRTGLPEFSRLQLTSRQRLESFATGSFGAPQFTDDVEVQPCLWREEPRTAPRYPAHAKPFSRSARLRKGGIQRAGLSPKSLPLQRVGHQNTKRNIVMDKKLALAISGMAITASFSLSAYAEDLRAVLLKPANGWVMEWSNPDTRNSGVTEAIFVDRGEGVVAKLGITASGADSGGAMSCERNVTINVNTVGYDGCRDRDIVLFFDASDTTYPFKSKDKSRNGYMFKVRAK